MFYAPWCGHCKKSKPAFQNAADSLKDNNKAFAAVDCTKNRGRSTKLQNVLEFFSSCSVIIKYT